MTLEITRSNNPRQGQHPNRVVGAIWRTVGALLFALSLYFIYHSRRLFSFDPAALGKYWSFKWIIMGHVVGGSLALLTGPFQLWAHFRTRYRRAHRVMGRVYIAATSGGAVCALILATTTAPSVNWPYALSLHMLATVWLMSGLLAWRTAQVWPHPIRTCGSTCAAVGTPRATAVGT